MDAKEKTCVDCGRIWVTRKRGRRCSPCRSARETKSPADRMAARRAAGLVDKAAHAASNKKYRVKARAKRLAYNKKWRAEHPGAARATRQRARSKPGVRERERAYSKAWNAAHKLRRTIIQQNRVARRGANGGRLTAEEFVAICERQIGIGASTAVPAIGNSRSGTRFLFAGAARTSRRTSSLSA